jgi:hypothetical protein
MEQKQRKQQEHARRKLPPRKEPTPNVLRKSVFDTKNYYYYYTEIRKDRNE